MAICSQYTQTPEKNLLENESQAHRVRTEEMLDLFTHSES